MSSIKSKLGVREITLSISTGIRWSGASFSALNTYCRSELLSRIYGGGSAASTSIGIIGAVLNTPSIFRSARFYSSYSGFLNWLWPLYYITDL